MKTTKTLSSVAQCAAAIRAELANEFPGQKFSVKSESFSMGNSVSIEWVDGPASAEVEAFTEKYEYGTFDSMTDCQGVKNRGLNIPQAKYVQERRTVSPEKKAAILAILMEKYTDELAKEKLHSECYKTSFYKRPEPKPAAAPTPTAPTVAGLEVVDYSERAIAVFGDTKPVKDQLKAIGGKFNPYLTKEGVKMAGWIFSKRHESAVRALVA